MTGEEKKKAIDALKISAPVRVMTQEEFSDYIRAINQIIDYLEQDTVSKESYDHEYFLRKELEVKIAKLERQESALDKVRIEIEALPKVYPFVTHVNTYVKEDDVRRIIDKYKSKIGLSVQGKDPEVCIGNQMEKGEKEMTWGDIYDEFCKKFPDADVEDYRPACELFIPQLAKGIPNAIIVWLKDGSKVIYIAESESETNGRNSI